MSRPELHGATPRSGHPAASLGAAAAPRRPSLFHRSTSPRSPSMPVLAFAKGARRELWVGWATILPPPPTALRPVSWIDSSAVPASARRKPTNRHVPTTRQPPANGPHEGRGPRPLRLSRHPVQPRPLSQPARTRCSRSEPSPQLASLQQLCASPLAATWVADDTPDDAKR